MERRVLMISTLLAIGSFLKADPPPFGTVVQRWSLRMSGSYAGAGITWDRDSGKLFLTDQGYAGPSRVWKLDVADPPGTIVQVPWTFTNLGRSTTDIPWGIAWDADSGCFWISQIVDGDVYGGCYLLRHVWNDSAWVWGGTARDSWFVGDGSNGGGLQCLWTAGMEKNEFTGVYYFVPVHSSPSPMNHIGKFDPYTKTNLGRLPHGDSIPERPLTLIPWDSAYIIACGWNSGFVKMDTLGRILQRAGSGGDGPADIAVEVPKHLEPDSTVWFYMMGSNSSNYFSKVSTGMSWRQLPSANLHSVRPSAVLAPVRAADSGEAVVPTLVVRNTAEVWAENVSVHFVIDDQADRVIFHDSLVTTLAPMSTDTVEFTAWTATGRDSMDAVAWTYWQDDSTRWDDTISQRFFVRVIDVSITAVESPIPGDTIDPDTVYPGCVLWNHGNITVTVPMVYNIGPYWDTVWVHNLIAGGSRAAIADRPWAASAGRWQCLMSAAVIGDLHPDNNDTSFVFYVRGDIDHDVEVSSIDAPVVLVDTLPFVPLATVRNNCGSTEQFCTHFWIEDTWTETRVYYDTIPVTLAGGQHTALAFRPCTLRVEGPYVASCSAFLAVDQNWFNNTLHQGFRVRGGVGISDKPGQRLAAEVPEPTVVRGVLRIGDGRRKTVDRADLLDVAGRKVAILRPGQNDIRHLTPGIYYIHTAGDFPASHKLVKLE